MRLAGNGLCAVLFLLVVSPGAAQQTPANSSRQANEKAASVQLSLEQVPVPPTSLPVLRLSPQKAPGEFILETLRQSNPEIRELVPLSQVPQLSGAGAKLPEEVVGALSNGHVAAYVDLRSGDAEVFPSFESGKLVAGADAARQSEQAQRLAREVFARPDIIQKDATQFAFETPRPVYGESAERGETAEQVKSSESGIYLTYVGLRRSVDGHFVYGPGSRAILAVGTGGLTEGFVRRWKTAAVIDHVRETRSREQVRAAILRELAPLARAAAVEVLSVEIAYYDGNRNYLLPVYRFSARIHQISGPGKGARGNRHVDDDFVLGYVPIGKTLESVPSLVAPPGAPPAQPKNVTARPPETGDPTVGRYVVRNDDPNWVANANEFWGGLTAFLGGGLFTNSQYFWAFPFEFNSSEGFFVNSVNVALNEVHGDWWLFSTLSNCCDLVDITAIPRSEGYGPANSGHLAYWILHSCEVVPSAADAPCPGDSRPWWTPWFNIFQGLHTVVGYRTIMWIDDDVTGPFAFSLRLGAPVVSAWFNAATGAAGYQGNPTFGAHCGRTPPMGRPSTVSACGRQNDWIYDTSALPPANCLINFWQPN